MNDFITNLQGWLITLLVSALAGLMFGPGLGLLAFILIIVGAFLNTYVYK